MDRGYYDRGYFSSRRRFKETSRVHRRHRYAPKLDELPGFSLRDEGDIEIEAMRFSQVRRKKDFKFEDKVNGRWINVLEGLELHTGVFNSIEQQDIVNFVYELQKLGREGKLRERTYSEPRKWMRGKGRVTMQFGCCYNYATDKKGRPPGIIRDEEVDPMPPFIKDMIRRLVRWRVLPATCVPNSCIINLYNKDDCIPPHIDHHDFVRPFCTVSFLSECSILFGKELKTLGPGEFSGSTEIPLPVGSVLVLKGNGADVAKHCVPAVPSKRISITFRRMDDSKLPFRFLPDPDLLNIKPLLNRSITASKPQFVSPIRPINPQKDDPNTDPREKIWSQRVTDRSRKDEPDSDPREKRFMSHIRSFTHQRVQYYRSTDQQRMTHWKPY